MTKVSDRFGAEQVLLTRSQRTLDFHSEVDLQLKWTCDGPSVRWREP